MPDALSGSSCMPVDGSADRAGRWLCVSIICLALGACGGDSDGDVVHSLHVQVQGWGDVTPPAGDHAHGSALTLTATWPVGWAFAGWSGDVTSTENPLMLTMSEDRAVVATFYQPTPYPNWNGTAVRKVLQTFAWGGLPDG